MALAVKTTKGRQKVAMEKMTQQSNLQVTFSKRRAGLFKKASELCTLCGAEIAIIIFSPGKKVFSFGHPSVESVVDRFLNLAPPQPSDAAADTMRLVAVHRSASVRELNVQLTQLQAQLEAEKKRGEALADARRAGTGTGQRWWWEAPLENMSMQQLEQLKLALEELKRNAAKQVDRLLMEAATNPPAAAMPPFFAGTPMSLGAPYDSKSAAVHHQAQPQGGHQGGGALCGPMNVNVMMPPGACNFGFGHGGFF